MYIERVPNRNSPPAILLREAFREGHTVRKRTLANLSQWPPELVEGFQTLLRGGTAVDIGASVGFYAYAFADIADRVVAFEPNPDYAFFARCMLRGRAEVYEWRSPTKLAV